MVSQEGSVAKSSGQSQEYPKTILRIMTLLPIQQLEGDLNVYLNYNYGNCKRKYCSVYSKSRTGNPLGIRHWLFHSSLNPIIRKKYH